VSIFSSAFGVEANRLRQPPNTKAIRFASFALKAHNQRAGYSAGTVTHDNYVQYLLELRFHPDFMNAMLYARVGRIGYSEGGPNSGPKIFGLPPQFQARHDAERTRSAKGAAFSIACSPMMCRC